MTHPFLMGLQPTLHISHRGGAKLYPENTVLAFSSAVENHGTDLLELDLHLSKDGELVVAHDATLDRCTNGTGELSAKTWKELQQIDAGYQFSPDGKTFPFRGQGLKLPRFADVLTRFQGILINVELKTAETIAPFVKLVRETGDVDRLCCGSQFDAIAEELQRQLPEACLFFPENALSAFILPVMGGEEPVDDPRYSVLDMPLVWEGVRLFSPKLRDEARARGKWINVWTVDDPAEMKQAIAEGVGGIMTDRPDVLRQVLDGV